LASTGGGGGTLSGKKSAGKKSAGKISVPILILYGKYYVPSSWDGGKNIDWREAPENFEGIFAYNWSLCVGKIQQFLSWPGKILSQSLKRPEKYCPKIWDRIFPTEAFPGRSSPLSVILHSSRTEHSGWFLLKIFF
jgi:hypothetical protein